MIPKMKIYNDLKTEPPTKKVGKYIHKDCRKCTRIIKNSKGFFCIPLKRYIYNYDIIGEYKTAPNSNIVLNIPEKDYNDPDCDFNPTLDYNPNDYYEPGRHAYIMEYII